MGLSSADLLRRCFAGDEQARDELVSRHGDWIHRHVRRQMRDHLRDLSESTDVVQEVLIDLLWNGPAYEVTNDEHLRALLGRMVVNRLRQLARYGRAGKRDLARARVLQSGEVSWVGPREDSRAEPDRHAEARELAARVQVALRIIDDHHREVIELHDYDGLPFADIGIRLGTSAKTANKRYARAVQHLGREMRRLRTGDLEHLVAD